jgi:hypothetical protein
LTAHKKVLFVFRSEKKNGHAFVCVDKINLKKGAGAELV